MGNKDVELSGDDIVVDGITYKGTLGLGSLILLKKPNDYTPDDMKKYKKLVEQTKVMTHPHNQTRKSKPKITWEMEKYIQKDGEEGS